MAKFKAEFVSKNQIKFIKAMIKYLEEYKGYHPDKPKIYLCHIAAHLIGEFDPDEHILYDEAIAYATLFKIGLYKGTVEKLTPEYVAKHDATVWFKVNYKGMTGREMRIDFLNKFLKQEELKHERGRI